MPFTLEQFLEVFRYYNLGVWPLPIGLYVMGVFALIFGTRTAPASDKAISLILAFLWVWMGVMYHISFFAAINKAAYLFGALFILQGGLFFYYKDQLVFRFKWDIYGVTGAIILFFAMAIYPAWNYINGHIFPETPTFGLPCPTAIFTLGMLLWTDKKLPLTLLVIPLLWSLVGFSAAFLFGITEDSGLLVAGVVAGFLLIRRAKQKNTAEQ